MTGLGWRRRHLGDVDHPPLRSSRPPPPHVAVFEPALIDALNLADGLMRSPLSLAGFLEACGQVALDRAGAILAARVDGEEER